MIRIIMSSCTDEGVQLTKIVRLDNVSILGITQDFS